MTPLAEFPDDVAWRACGRRLSRYRERFGAIEPRDHEHDVLIVLSALRLAQDRDVPIVTEDDADLTTWLSLMPRTSGVRIAAVRSA